MNSLFAILPLAGSALCIALGLLTLTRNPMSPANIGFFMGMIGLVVVQAGGALILIHGPEGDLSSTGVYLGFAGQALLPPLWFFFSTVFARENYWEVIRRWAPVLAVMGLVSIFFIFRGLMPGFVYLWSSEAEPAYFIIGPWGRYFYIYLIIGLVLSLVQLESTYRSSEGKDRGRVKYVLFGVGGALGFFIYLASHALLFSSLYIEVIPLISAVVIISTLLMALSIVKHRLMDVHIYVSRSVFFSSVTVLIVGLYLLAVGTIAHGIKFFDMPFEGFFSVLFVFVSVLLIAALVLNTALTRKVKLFISRHFYRQKHSFRDKWMESIEKINPIRSAEELKNAFAGLISGTMGASSVHLWRHDASSGDYVTNDEEVPEGFGRLSRNHPVVRHMEENPGHFFFKDIDKGSPEGALKEINSLREATGAVLLAPLSTGHGTIGFVLLGSDVSGEKYTQDDFEILKAYTTQAAVQIKNIELTSELVHLKEMEAFGRMSSFIIHDLKNLTNSLSMVSQNARANISNPEFQKDAVKTIDTTVKRMKGLIEKLSKTREKLEIKKSPLGLKEVIDCAIEKLHLNVATDIAVKSEVDPALVVNADPEAMDTVFFNILTNALEAMGGRGGRGKGGLVTVRAASFNGMVDVAITDNGPGISEKYIRTSLFRPFRTTKSGGFGIGLFQCKAIVEAHGGNISVESKEGSGTTFMVSLPKTSPSISRNGPFRNAGSLWSRKQKGVS